MRVPSAPLRVSNDLTVNPGAAAALSMLVKECRQLLRERRTGTLTSFATPMATVVTLCASARIAEEDAQLLERDVLHDPLGENEVGGGGSNHGDGFVRNDEEPKINRTRRNVGGIRWSLSHGAGDSAY